MTKYPVTGIFKKTKLRQSSDVGQDKIERNPNISKGVSRQFEEGITDLKDGHTTSIFTLDNR